MRFEKIPGTSSLWADFAGGSLPELPFFQARHTIQSLVSHANTLRFDDARRERICRLLPELHASAGHASESIQRLRRSDTFVILTNYHVSFFGGPLFQFFKCLTAVKICEELEKRNVAAIPVCWITSDPAPGLDRWSVSILDSRSDLRRLSLQRKGRDISPEDAAPVEEITGLIAQIGDLVGDSCDAETIEILSAAYSVGGTLSSACARLLSSLLQDLGLTVLNPPASGLESIGGEALARFCATRSAFAGLIREQEANLARAGYPAKAGGAADHFVSLTQSSILPVLGIVISACEVYDYLSAAPLFCELDLARPLAWPQVSATILDAASRRILEKHGLNLSDLFEGREELLSRIGHEKLTRSVLGELDSLSSAVEAQISDLGVPAPRGKPDKKIDLYEKRTVYQLGKMRRLCANAGAVRRETIDRQLKRVCNSLAPNGQSQERELAGIHFLLRYSSDALRILRDKLSTSSLEHQLISMD